MVVFLNLKVGGISNMAVFLNMAVLLKLKKAESLNMAAFVNLLDDCIFKYGGKFKFQNGRSSKVAEYLNMAA
jgi:hypothetical protein